MLLIEHTGSIGHFRFDPDTKLYLIFSGIAQQAFNTIRKFLGINHPVAERTVISNTRIFGSEPSIIHHEEFTTHTMDISHHLVHSLLVDVEINTFPRVEQDITLLISMCQDIFASPFMEVSTCTAQALC